MSTATEPRAFVPTMTFGDRVRLARRHAGMSGVELSKALGMARTAVGYWESTGREPRSLIAVAKEIARITGVSWVWLVSGDAPDQRPDGSMWSEVIAGQRTAA